jgi:hypothetical protein
MPSTSSSPSIASTSHLNTISTRERPPSVKIALKRTAIQLLILKLCFTAQCGSIPPLHLTTLDMLVNKHSIQDMPFVTLRQAFYNCKPLLSRVRLSKALDGINNMENIDHEFGDPEEGSPGLMEGDQTMEGNESTQTGRLASVSPSYIYKCISNLTSNMNARREHLSLEAEGKALFCIKTDFRTSSIALDSPIHLIHDVVSHFQHLELVTNHFIKELEEKLAILLSCLSSPSTQVPPLISIVVIEKEGIFDQVSQRWDARVERKVDSWNAVSYPSYLAANQSYHSQNVGGIDYKSGTPIEDDYFETLVMNSLFPSPPTETNPKFHLRRDSLLFMVCLKGFPCHASRKLLRILHQFHTLVMLQSFRTPHPESSAASRFYSSCSRSHSTPNWRAINNFLDCSNPYALQAPPIRCFVDCNPSGILIMQSLLRNPSHVEQQGTVTTDLFPLLWCGLLPSQLLQFPISTHQCQTLTERDKSLLVTLDRQPLHDSIRIEIEIFFKHQFKAELQSLF